MQVRRFTSDLRTKIPGNHKGLYDVPIHFRWSARANGGLKRFNTDTVDIEPLRTVAYCAEAQHPSWRCYSILVIEPCNKAE